jgi:hypothetical protein
MWRSGASRACKKAAALAAAAGAIALASCGGSGGSAEPGGPTLSGVAATGAPMQNATVRITCAAGPVRTGTTGANGAWTVTLDDQAKLPCIVSAEGGTPPVVLHSVATAAGTVNITPLTNLVVASAAGDDPAAWLAANSGQLSTALGTLAASLPAAQAAVVESLADAGYELPSGDFMTMAFTPAAGDPYDDLLEAVAAGLADSGLTYADLVERVAEAGTTPVAVPKTDVITAAQVAAMPQLNNATVAVSNGIAMLETADGTGQTTVGAFFGGGTGNKAVLQVPGLAGLKVKDLQQVVLEVKAGSLPSPGGQPSMYINILVDLDCSMAPLPATALAQQVRERRRLLIYDPYYKFILQDNAISTTAFSTVAIAPDMPGWRISPGAATNPAGQESQDTGVMEAQQSTGKLSTFDHAKYPNACIVDGISADGGLFRDKSADPSCDTSNGLDPNAVPASCGKLHSGFLVILSDSANRPASGQWQLRKLMVNERAFTFQ